ncbi:hypothetical protein KQI42_10630 [Tissierella sp. MSJ-40]|uniref:Uncharacterized protein n=1 Tax=Tissierella simiarum TaxID=2841534 RepID=A0ABS6E6D2_9FIRM|nr:hypothetical protein [Tissierella simiarum]MBU5438467.1 hypothetical protein [Tissierella simiarum]
MNLKVQKISDKVDNLDVKGQGGDCKFNCKVTVWKGKRSKEESSSCWYNDEGYNARGNPFF